MTNYPEALVERAIRTGCAAADIHIGCSWPECSCKQLPTAIRAALNASPLRKALKNQDWWHKKCMWWHDRATLAEKNLREVVEALEAIRATIPAIVRGDRNVIDIADIIYPLLARIKRGPHA